MNVYLKKRIEQDSVDAAQTPDRSPRHSLPLTTSSDFQHMIQVGSFYEIDHSKLSSKAPEQLKSIRVVMASERTKLIVALRFPSVYSLRTHFRSNSENSNEKKLPALNEKYVMASDLAEQVLYRRIPAQEIAGRNNSWDFWVVPSMAGEKDPKISSPASSVERDVASDEDSKNGVCWSKLKFAGLVQWGERRHVRYIGRHEDGLKLEPMSRSVKEEIAQNDEKEKEGSNCEIEAEDENDDDEEQAVFKRGFKRERPSTSRLNQKIIKKAKRNHGQKKNRIIQVHKRPSKKKEVKKSIDRWSAERYGLAEENMLKIMKAKGAVFGKPVLRPQLRAEARKLIGDTGLLDHLLKHMAGKVAPGGIERFRRRHNADGAMEYWLESADLVNIRKEAGVQDPYWTPHPGWKPGDNPSQDPVCAREIFDLKQEISELKKVIQELEASREQKDLGDYVRTPSCIVTGLFMDVDDESSVLLPLKKNYKQLLNRKAKIEEQMKEISQYMTEMEEKMEILKRATLSEEQNMSGSLLPHGTITDSSERKTKEIKDTQKKAADEEGDIIKKTREVEKAERIERLKSGFRICKPHGSFLWPNNNMSPYNYDPLLHHVVPTPPSASSTSAVPIPLNIIPTSPVKPLARRPSTTTAPSYASQQSLGITHTACINLNEIPLLGQNADTTTPPPPLTYHRKSPVLPRLGEEKKDNEEEEMKLQVVIKEASSSSSGSSNPHNNSLFSTGADHLWLALSTINSSHSAYSKKP